MNFNFDQCRVIVIGDVMIDRYTEGRVTRVSPEAPVPVIAVKRTYDRAGGAANVASNVRGLEAACVLYGAGQLVPCSVGVDSRLLLADTIVKHRFIGNGFQLCRVDHDYFFDWEALPYNVLEGIISEIVTESMFSKTSIILSDYGKGFVCASLASQIIENSKSPVLVDPKDGSWEKYSGAFCIKPNLFELSKRTGIDFISGRLDQVKLERETSKLSRDLKISNIWVTLGDKGSYLLFEGNTLMRFQAPNVEVADATGAGDTALAVAATMVASGSPMSVAGFFATRAASKIVARKGTQAIKLKDLKEEKV